MKMKEVTQQEFEKVISSLEEDSYTVGNDVGRTHGITCYQRSGRLIGTSHWIKNDNVKVFTYEVANYLYEAYCKECSEEHTFCEDDFGEEM